MSPLQSLRQRFGANSAYAEDMYQLFQIDPSLVEESWRLLFEGLGGQEAPNTFDHSRSASTNGVSHKAQQPEVLAPSGSEQTGYYIGPAEDGAVQERIYRMISAFRGRGHFGAKVNPLTRGIVPLPVVEDAQVEFYQFSEEQLEKVYHCAGLAKQERMRLSEIIEELQKIYCSNVGFEFTHLVAQEERLWLQKKIEGRFQNGYRLTLDQKLRRLQKIIDAEAFESELHRKYVGHKRFSLQGAETLIPMLDTLLEEAGREGIAEVVLGMPHRGRLNVLVNTLGKPLEEIFSEFQDQNIFSALGSGDVKYHMGFKSSYRTPAGESLELLLAPNPSHLEFIDPVVEGMVRAIQDERYGKDRRSVLPLLIHGDAAFAGQGVVFETLNMANVEGYTTGGTVHIIVNNQIGFTTTPDESRSSIYCTDMAKAIQAPVFHVNCENVEAACWTVKTALDFRNRYGRDVIIDLYCYRRYGHNEGDDPSFTQPVTYSEIEEKESIATGYGKRLIEEGYIEESQVKEYFESFRERFERAHEVTSSSAPIGEACSTVGRFQPSMPPTGVSGEALSAIARTLVDYPEGFEPHPKLSRILQRRVDTLEKGEGIEWGFAEALSFGSLMLEGRNIRLSGQDSGRGTFSQRHLALKCFGSPEVFFPLNSLREGSSEVGEFEVVNSTLSEAGVLGFEFGYSTVGRTTLVLWEAQFGDFVNGAQVHIDQFLTASEAKWNQKSGLALLLPHGYEGQGPEHSSARLERFLLQCAEGNMTVCYPSSAGQYFHLLRRQGLLRLQRPLVVMTPKSLLRLPEAACSKQELTEGSFNKIIREDFGPEGHSRAILFLTGKIYYDVVATLREHPEIAVSIIRVEQLYPLDLKQIESELSDINPVVQLWIQEEPENMGAWRYIRPNLEDPLGIRLSYVGRPASASTAAGSAKRHMAEQKKILNEMLGALA